MVRHLSHDGWVKQQFQEKYLKAAYRNVLLHASILESILTNESDAGTFDSANKRLLCAGRTNRFDFCVFNEIRAIRNELVHRIFKKRLAQDVIDALCRKLMKKVLEAYRGSIFLNETLFLRYQIDRGPSIGFTPAFQ